MDLNIIAKHIDLTSEAETYINKKFRRLERHIRSLSDAKLEVSRTSARARDERFVAQMTLTVDGAILRGETSGTDLFAAVDAVTDVLDRQVQRFKGKSNRAEKAKRSGRAGARRVAEPPEPGDDVDAPGIVLPELGKVVRGKQFTMRPMSVEDAILEMELVGHTFYLFDNIDSGRHSVVYRRRDGDYGLIEPRFA